MSNSNMHARLLKQLQQSLSISSSEHLQQIVQLASRVGRDGTVNADLIPVLVGLGDFFRVLNEYYQKLDELAKTHRCKLEHSVSPADDAEELANVSLSPGKCLLDRLDPLRQQSEQIICAIDQHTIISLADAQGVIQFVNDRFCLISGYSRSALLGKNYHQLNAHVHPNVFFHELWQTICAGKIWQGEICNRNKNGELFWTHTTIVPLQHETQKTYQFVTISTDITQLKQTEHQLLQARDQADAASRAKSAFLANMSHEIRTPMNAIIGLSYLILQTQLSEKQRDYLQKVYGSSKLLLSLMNDVLDFSKIEAGKMRLEQVSFELETVMSHLMTVVNVKAEEKGLLFLLRIAENIPHSLIGDPLRLGQVLVNLAANAVKFTNQGGVFVMVLCDNESENEIELRFIVRDSGIGLAQDQIDQLFVAFTQANSSTGRLYGGTGLGLAICKHLVEQMQGKIWVESTPGNGASFIFTARFGKNASSLQQQIDTQQQIRNGMLKVKGAHLLVVEDNLFNQQVVLALLDKLDISSTLACNGREALDLLDQEKFDGVLMDIYMPEMDGLTATCKIRSCLDGAHLPIIAMSGNASDAEKDKAFKAGLNDFLCKPLNHDQLLMTLAKWIVPMVKQAESIQQSDIVPLNAADNALFYWYLKAGIEHLSVFDTQIDAILSELTLLLQNQPILRKKLDMIKQDVNLYHYEQALQKMQAWAAELGFITK